MEPQEYLGDYRMCPDTSEGGLPQSGNDAKENKASISRYSFESTGFSNRLAVEREEKAKIMESGFLGLNSIFATYKTVTGQVTASQSQ